MTISDHWLRRPDFDATPHAAVFRAALDDAVRTGVGAAPNGAVWPWLCWLCDDRGFLSHGTGRADIGLFEPRQSNDVGWFGNRKAVYASSDALWAMFYAVMDRPAVSMKIVNAAVNMHADGVVVPLYFFGVSSSALSQRAFRNGWVYFLPSDTFEREPPETASGVVLDSHQLASLEPVRPAFRVPVSPSDFPFLHRIHAYEPQDTTADRGLDPSGEPWITD